MRKPVATMMALALILSSILPGVRPASPQVVSAHAPLPPIPPAPTPPPAGPDVAGQSPLIPPSPDSFPPEVKEARARQAIEAVLEKHLRYWGPRYRVSPVEVTVEGAWSHGVVQWQSQARTLEEPIHILAHRLPDGVWQALMPSTDGLYLQWVDAAPESLVPPGEKVQLRTQAAEADALRRPQAIPIPIVSQSGYSSPVHNLEAALPEQFQSVEVAILPRGSGFGEIGIVEGPHGEPPIGPSSIFATDYGDVLVLDSVNHRVTVLSVSGTVQREMEFDSDAWGADLAADARGNLHILDIRRNHLIVFEQSSHQPLDLSLPLDEGFQASRLAMGIDARIEIGGWQIYGRETFPQQSVLAFKPSFLKSPQRGISTTLHPGTQSTRRGLVDVRFIQTGERSGQVVISNEAGVSLLSVPVETQAPLVGITLLGYDDHGNSYIYVLTSITNDDGMLLYSARLDKYSPTGKVLATVPLSMDMHTFPERPLMVTGDGSVYQLFPERDRVRIIRWQAVSTSRSLVYSPQLRLLEFATSPCLAVRSAIKEKQPGITAPTLDPITRDQIMATAQDYSNHTWTVGSSNYDARTCPNGCPVGPAAWPVGTQITGVAYQWGGWDTISGFDWKLSQEYLAGDVSGTACVGDCATGVDCSGFVQQTWQIVDQKHNASQLVSDTYSEHIEWSQLERGDALGIAGSHITLFSNRDAQGHIAIYESVWGTTYKVRYYVDTWGYLNGYEARRRHDVSDGSDCSDPSLNSPNDGYIHTSSDRTVTFSWSPPPDCTPDGYTFRVKTVRDMDSGGTTIFDEGQGGTGVTKQFDSEWDNTDLYWSVRACKPCTPYNPGPWAPARHFRIQPGGSDHPVRLYEHAGSGGSGLLFPQVDYAWWNLTDYDFNDVASSIEIDSGWSARLWLDTDLQPSNCHKCLTSSDSDFNGDHFDGGCGASLNDLASSIEVFHNTSCSIPCNPNADQVALYADTGYGGSCVTLDIGDYPNPGHLGDLGNDNAESIKVGSNVQATLCQHDDYQGRCETFTGDDSNLGDNHIGANEVSSVRVQSLTQPPPAPTLQLPGNGSVHNEGTSLTLAWNSVANATAYYAEYWGGPAGTLNSGWQSGISWYIGSQWAGYTYSWRVKARNDAGESGWSDTWTFTVRPAAPSNLSAQTASCTQINLYWDDNSGNEEGYKIYRDGSYADQVGANTTSYQDTGLNENTGYPYYVKAFRGSIESDASNTVNVTTPPCAPPQPDLRPYAMSGYPYPVVPSSIPSTHEVNTLYAGQPTYFDWHFVNSGDATASGDFHVELWVDDTRYVRYPYSDYGAGWSSGFDDWIETIATPGWHTVRLITDPDDTVTESDENNNVWEHQFYWTSSAPYADDVESGANDWTATGLWHQVDASSPYPESHSGSHSWWYGQDSSGDYDTGAANSGDLTSPPVYIPDTGYYLRFWYRYETETQGPGLDQRWVQISVDGGPFENVLQLSDDPMNWWLQSPAIDLSGYAGHVVQVRFHFDTLDAYHNDYRGWYIDDFDISTTPPPACADSHEPNDTPAQATAIAYGQTLSADICPGGDYDFYTFTGTAGDKVVVDIDAKVNGSLLDSYVFLLDSDGTSVLAEHDDEILVEVQDSLLGYQLPHDGTYYVKVKAWNHPSVGDADHFYTIHLLTDDANPSSAEVTSPITDSWLNPATVTVTVSATDDESGINRVEFLWHDADWENSDWEWLGADHDSRDGWSWGFDTGGLAEQQGGAFYIWAFDWVGNWTGAAVWNLGIDSTPPTTTVSLSPMYGDAPFRDFHVWWYGSDDLSGIASYDVQYRDGAGGAWTDLAISITETYTRFVGLDGHTYYFRARARDFASNQNSYAGGDGDAHHTVDICDTAPDAYEADNTAGSANLITTDGALQIHNIHAEGDQDWIKFYAAAGVTYTLATTNTGGHADTVLYLYDTDGSTLIDYNDDYPGMWPASRLDWQPSASGVYYAKVDHWDPWAYGCTTEYDLHILTDDETPPSGQITSPSGGTTVNSCPLVIQADVSDSGSGVDFVEFHAYYDGDWHHLGDDDTSPYSWNWDCSSVGDQGVWFTIHVWDRAGNEIMDPGGYVYVTLERPSFHVFLPCVLRGSHVSNE